MLSISNVGFAQRSSMPRFGSKQAPDIRTNEGKRAIISEATALKMNGDFKDAEDKYRLVFERDNSEFIGSKGIDILKDAGFGLSTALLKQGFRADFERVVDQDKAAEAPVVLLKLERRLITKTDRIARLYADEAKDKAVAIREMFIQPNKELLGIYLRKLDAEKNNF